MLDVQTVGLLKVFSLERELGDRGLGQEQRPGCGAPEKTCGSFGGEGPRRLASPPTTIAKSVTRPSTPKHESISNCTKPIISSK